MKYILSLIQILLAHIIYVDFLEPKAGSNGKMEHYLQNNKQIMMDEKRIISYLDREIFTTINNTSLQDDNISKYNLFLQHLDNR